MARGVPCRVHNREAIMVPGMLRRCSVGGFYEWRRSRKNRRQRTFHDAMNAFNQRPAFVTTTARP